jgi:hypothetical protein
MRGVVALLAASSVLSLGGCQLNVFSDGGRHLDAEASEPFSTVIDATDEVVLNIEGINGLVSIVGDAASTQVDVSAVLTVRSDTRADAEEYLGRVSVEVAEVGDAIEIWTDQPTNTGGREVIVDYELSVPDYLVVEVVNTNGDVEVSSVNDDVTASNVNGTIELTDVVGDVEATLVNGDIDADLTLLSGGVVDLTVVNGEIDLVVPASVSAVLDADVVNGTVVVTGLTITDATTTTRSVHGRLGGGDGLIELDVTNGTIRVSAR